MKTKILAFLSALTCLCFLVSPLCCFALVPELAGIIAETTFSYIIGESNEFDETGHRKGLAGVAREVQNKLWAGSFLNPLQTTDDIAWTIPKYDIITGKYQLHYIQGNYTGLGELESTTEEDILIEVTCLLSDRPNYLDDGSIAVRTAEGTNTRLFPNALNVSITRSKFPNRTERYIVSYNNFNYVNRALLGANTFTINSGYADVYLYTGDKLENKLFGNFYVNTVRFETVYTNSINENLNDLQASPSGYLPLPVGFYSNWGSSIPSSQALDYPIDFDILHGGFQSKYMKVSTTGGSNTYSGVVFNPLNYLKISGYVTNDPVKERTIQNNNQWTQPNQQIYYIDKSFTGGTVINSTNYNDYTDKGFDLPFLLPDVDLPSLPLSELAELLGELLPDFSAKIQPSLDFNMDSLFDRLLDFYGNMPDINSEWNLDPELNNNDYWSVDLPDFPSDGGGGGTVTPWEPPEYKPVNTAPFIPATYPTIPTGTLPINYAQGLGSVLQDGWDIFDSFGFLSILCPLVVIVLLWRITGK